MGKQTGRTGMGLGLAATGVMLSAALAAPAQAQGQSAWVKLCEKANLQSLTQAGKPKSDVKDICLTHHERLDGNTGMVIVSAAIREVKGADKKSLMIMVPLGMALPPGVRAAVYTVDQWKKAQGKQKIDEKALKPIQLKYSLCHPAGCTAEVEATPELIESMKKGGGMMILAINASGKPVGFPVPLTGFTKAHEGKPVDNKLYARERGKLMSQIRKRMAQKAKAARAARKARQEAQQDN